MNPVVETTCGAVEGLDCGTHYEFRGIPFARPPVGDLRWKAPRPCEPWEGCFKANHFAPKAMQDEAEDMGIYTKEFYSDPSYDRDISEDCLYLNIWCPKEMEGRKYPVAVWIHGGAFMHGYSSEMEFDGEAFCERGVILVSIAYRMGLFGFLSIPELTKEEGHSGNYGLMDQIEALRWVQNNIASFSGDPSNVTLFGQSAGCVSVQDLCCSPLTEGLFAKAILQSGAGYHPPLSLLVSQEELNNVFQELLHVLQVSSFAEMRNYPAKMLNDSFMKTPMVQKGWIPGPCIDGYVLEKTPDEIIEEGKMRDIPYIIGSTKDDLLTEGAGPDHPSGELWEGELRLIDKLKTAGKKVPYLYYFVHDLPGNQDGAFHSAELWYVFGTWKRCWRPMGEEDARLSRDMTDDWCRFMKTGQPGHEGEKEAWLPCTKGEYRLYR